MPERASIFQTVQIGPETTPGTAVPTTKRLKATNIELQPDGNLNAFAPSGSKFDSIVQLGREFSSGPADGIAAYNDLAYILSSVMNKVTATGGGAAKTWAFEIDIDGADTVQTYTVEKGSDVRAHRIAHVIFTGFDFTFDRSEVRVSGDMFGYAIEDAFGAMSGNAVYTLTANATPPTAGTFTLTYSAQTTGAIAYNATPAAVQTALEALSNIGAGNIRVWLKTGQTGTLATADNVYYVAFAGTLGYAARTLTGTFTGLTASGSIAIASAQTGSAIPDVDPVPVQASLVDVYIDPSGATLGSTKATRVLRGSLSIGGRFNPLWVVNSANASFQTWVEQKPTATISLTLEADAEGMSYLQDMRVGTTRFIRIMATSGTNYITATTPYSITFDAAVKVAEMVKLSDQDGVYAIEIGFTVVSDSTWGHAIQATLVNAIGSL